jgi:excisionase family DNA binding protein
VNTYKIVFYRMQRSEVDITVRDRDTARSAAEEELGRLYVNPQGWRTVAADINIVDLRAEPQASYDQGPSDRRPVLLSTTDAAKYLSISRTTLYSLIKTGDLPTVTIGRRRFVSQDQLSEYVVAASDGVR